MLSVIKDYIRIKYNQDTIDGCLLFGSTLSNISPNDVDIVIFTSSKTFVHFIDCFNNITFDVFEMSLDKAFYYLKIREPMWLSAFSSGKSIAKSGHIELLIETAKEIRQKQLPVLSSTDLNRLLFQLENSFNKLKANQEQPHFYLHYSSHYLNIIKLCLFHHKGIYPDGMKKQIAILTEEFGDISQLIQKFITESHIKKKHKIAVQLYNNVRSLYRDKVNYPVLISKKEF